MHRVYPGRYGDLPLRNRKQRIKNSIKVPIHGGKAVRGVLELIDGLDIGAGGEITGTVIDETSDAIRGYLEMKLKTEHPAIGSLEGLLLARDRACQMAATLGKIERVPVPVKRFERFGKGIERFGSFRVRRERHG